MAFHGISMYFLYFCLKSLQKRSTLVRRDDGFDGFDGFEMTPSQSPWSFSSFT